MTVVNLQHGDCLDILPTLESGSIDCVVTDPPYNVGFDYGGGHDDKNPDYEIWCAEWLSELHRVCSGAIAISCGIVNLAMWTRIREPNWVMCWWKPAAMGRSPVGFCNWEPILLYGKSKGDDGVDVVRAPVQVMGDTGNHPCPKPIKWATGFVALLSQKDHLVLDPFMGSGTTGIACAKLGRSFIGIEKDAGYFKIAERRIREAQSQLRLEI